MSDDDQFLETLDEMTWWLYDNTCVGMGAERQFDYTMRGDLGRDLSPRLGKCYELAMGAFTGWERFNYHRTYRASLGQDPEPQAREGGLPAPLALVHGSWHGPDAPGRINHAWVVLEDGRMWEPVTGLICDPVLFMTYAQCEVHRSYSETQARVAMLRAQHYGPWNEED